MFAAQLQESHSYPLADHSLAVAGTYALHSVLKEIHAQTQRTAPSLKQESILLPCLLLDGADLGQAWLCSAHSYTTNK